MHEIAFSSQQVVDLYQGLMDSLFTHLFMVHQSEENFPPLQLKLLSRRPFMVSGAGLSIACDSLSPGTPQLHLAQLCMK